MQFYECELTFEGSGRKSVLQALIKTAKRNWGDEVIQDLNENFLEVQENLAILIYKARVSELGKIGEFGLIIASDSLQRLTPTNLSKILEKNFVESPYALENVKIKSIREITPAQVSKCISFAGKSDFLTYRSDWERGNLRQHEHFSLNYYNNEEFRIKENLFDDKKLSRAQALKKAKNLMADKSFIDELERIYSDKNPKNFYGHPVHYKLVAKNSQGANQLAELLCRALYENKRLIGRCVSCIYEITEQCYGEWDLAHIFEQSAGNTIVIELRGSKDEHKNYASCYEEVVKDLEERVKKHQQNTLFIFVETTENPGFAPKLIQTLQEDIYLVEVSEGTGNRAEAAEYFKELLKQGKVSLEENEIENLLGDKTTFRPSDLHKIYDTVQRDNLRNNTYTAYKQVSRLMVAKDDLTGKDAYKRLQEMIGLTEIKTLISQIIGNAKIQKIRSAVGLEQQKTSMHMVFTGNPGSAKTTVARLLAEIMSKEGILKTGEFIECGRADLVGKYVGWTAPSVKRQFKLARGGVLFIDEAYSLVESEQGLYGDEAINTIVQEMENHRDDVIVIFAGYPDKMKKFLERNEGLRSRIAFHVDFPNYNANELLQILQLMAKDKGFKLDSEIEKKCLDIFNKVHGKQDFGNGRFVRNLLEQALLKQSKRILTENEGKEIGRTELLQLKAEDFEVNVVSQYSSKKTNIGFKI